MEALSTNPVAPLTLLLTLQLAVLDSEVNAVSVTTTEVLVLLVTLWVPLFASLTAPVTTIKSPTSVLEKAVVAAVRVDPLNVNVSLVSFVLASASKKDVEYVPLLVNASGSANLKWFTVPFSSKRNVCQFTASDLLMGGKETSAVQ